MNTRPAQQTTTLIAIVLTFASGAADVAAFTRLGNVFTSVVTGDIVLFGLSLARRSLTLAAHTGVAVGGYIVGVAVGAWVAHGVKASRARRAAEAADGAAVLAAHVIWSLRAELILLAVLVAGWEASGGHPAGWGQFCLLAVLAAAMGLQSSAVRDMGLSDVSTTYLTGTLTGLVSSLVSPGQDTPHGVRRFGVLVGLLAGAVLSGLLLATAIDGVPFLPLAAVAVTLVLASGRSWSGRLPGRVSRRRAD
jgi:uncharacterized membrane protein YoaK (UPF0700 family)